MAKVRINRALAMAGVASRRKAEELVRAGRVRLNGKVIDDLATQVDPAADKLELDGRPLALAGRQHYYYLYYKPRGIVCTLSDENERPCVGEICGRLPGTPRPVGRLDRASEGLLLLTNDGELANRLTHPRYEVVKEYQVTVTPPLRNTDAAALVAGVELDDGPARLLTITLNGTSSDRSQLSVTVAEGRNRLIRRLFEQLGYQVRRLKRDRLGTLVLGKLKPGDTRPLLEEEVQALLKLTGLACSSPRSRSRP